MRPFKPTSFCAFCLRTINEARALYKGHPLKKEHDCCGRCWNEAVEAGIPPVLILKISREDFFERLYDQAKREEQELERVAKKIIAARTAVPERKVIPFDPKRKLPKPDKK